MGDGWFGRYEYLLFERPSEGVLLVTQNRPEQGNANIPPMHTELYEVWSDIARDDETRVVVITGAGDRFSLGGDMSGTWQPPEQDRLPPGQAKARSFYEVAGLAEAMINLDKPIVSAINGSAVASGAALALCADISVMREDARLSDGHARGGMVAGDHASWMWPLLTSLSKAKYYLMTAAPIDGREAERIGLVTFAVPATDVLPRALEIAAALAAGPQHAIRWTKRTLNHWARQQVPIHELSTALELLSASIEGGAQQGEAMRLAMRDRERRPH